MRIVERSDPWAIPFPSYRPLFDCYYRGRLTCLSYVLTVSTFFNKLIFLVGGSITLNSSDPFSAPLIDPALLKSDFDLEVMKYSIRSAQRFVSSPVWKDYIIAPLNGAQNTTMVGTDEELEAYIRANGGTVFHPVGTASMAPANAQWGVVDPDLRVKGLSGLRVVDVSVLVSFWI